MSERIKFYIDTDTGCDNSDETGWYSYQLVSEGNSIDELFDNAFITHVDQHGGDLVDPYPLEHAPANVQRVSGKILRRLAES